MPRTRLANLGRVAEHNLYDLRSVFPTTGNIWFVDSGAASGGNGLSPEAAVQTIDAAINLATASNGDIIIVMEGHAETVIGAAGIALDVAGLTVVGLGRGRNRPVITFGTADAASCDITGANVHVENLVFLNARDGQTAMVNITGANVTVKGCEFVLGDGCTQAVLGILTTDAADRLLIEGNYFHGPSAAGVTAAIRIVGTDDTRVIGNTVTGHFATTGAIEQVTTAGNRHLYKDNIVWNGTADGNNATIFLKSDTTGMLTNNIVAAIDSTCPAVLVGAGAMYGHNYHVAAVNTAGTLK